MAKYIDGERGAFRSAERNAGVEPINKFAKAVRDREKQTEETIKFLDLTYKQSIVDLLFEVEAGYVSARRAADEIMKAHDTNKGKL